MSTHKNKLCLNMIVKNESKIIIRLLDSVLSIIDSYCICDTGSTDNTISIIENYFKDKNKVGEVFTEPFKDFAYNRNIALHRASKWGEYALLIDADMKLEISPNFNKNSLTADVYQIPQKNPALNYYNTRIVRTDIGVKCVGVTHEYYDTPAGHSIAKTDQLVINDIGDGGCKSDKFERDIRLLRKGLLDDPKNVRYHFYLANSYRDHGHQTGNKKELKKAIKWYKRRIELGQWSEEVFISCLEVGRIYKELGKPDKAVYWWIEGYANRSNRSETLYEIIKYYREKGVSYAPIAGHFYNIAKNIPYPKDDVLFIHKNVYDYLLDEEYAIIAYYAKWPVDWYKFLNIIGKPQIHDGVLSNYRFYAKQLVDFSPRLIKFNGMVKYENHKDDFYPSTPSILPYNNGFIMNQRYVNYYIEPNGSYRCNMPITTMNHQVYLDSEFNVIKSHDFNHLPEIIDRYAGIEDIRLCQYGDNIMFLGTQQNIENKQLTVAGGIYPLNTDSHNLDSTLFISPTNSQCEKNWCYFEHNGTLKVIYRWGPLQFGQISDKTLHLEEPITDVPKFFNYLRGSTNGFIWNDEIWFMTHMVDCTKSPRIYYHCIIILDRNTLKLKRNSILFKLDNTCVEYCLGLIVEDKRLIIGYSKMDRETILAIYDREKIDSFLFPQ